MTDASRRPTSVCVYCGSSNDADPRYLQAATDLGLALAKADMRLVYGGGGVGLMGATARAAHDNGGKVLGIMPEFLRSREILYDDVETIVVQNMHERKMIMFEQSDAFVVLPGGIGTLEEIVELLSWRRLDLHAKPTVFANIDGFWNPLFELFEHTIEASLTPASFREAWTSVDSIDQIVPAIRSQLQAA